MSDDIESPIPWGLVEHVHRTSTGKTTMQISLPIELRARMAQAALDLGCSKLALIRAAISQFLTTHEETRRAGQERAFSATSEVIPPVLGREPVETSEPAMAVPEPSPVMEPEPAVRPEPELEHPEPVMEIEQAPKRSRAKKGRTQ